MTFQKISMVGSRERKQEYKWILLSNYYGDDVMREMKPYLLYVDKKFDHLELTLKGADGKPSGAIYDRGNYVHIKTSDATDQEVAALVALVGVKGWPEVEISGTDNFQAKAWLALSLAGVTVRNYQPTPEQAAALAVLRQQQPECGIAAADALPPAEPIVMVNAIKPVETPEPIQSDEPAAPAEMSDATFEALARKWLATAAPVDSFEAEEIVADVPRMLRLYVKDPAAQHWHRTQMDLKAGNVPPALVGLERFGIDEFSCDGGEIIHVGKNVWIKPPGSDSVAVAVPAFENAKIGLQVQFDENGKPQPVNKPKPAAPSLSM